MIAKGNMQLDDVQHSFRITMLSNLDKSCYNFNRIIITCDYRRIHL